MSRHVSLHDVGGQIGAGPVLAKRLELCLGLPLLVDVDATGLQGICGHDEVPASPRAACLYHRVPGRGEEGLSSPR